jgi:hypothetical protein
MASACIELEYPPCKRGLVGIDFDGVFELVIPVSKGRRGRLACAGSPLFSKTAHRRIVISPPSQRIVTSASACNGSLAFTLARSIRISVPTSLLLLVPVCQETEKLSKCSNFCCTQQDRTPRPQQRRICPALSTENRHEPLRSTVRLTSICSVVADFMDSHIQPC